LKLKTTEQIELINFKIDNLAEEQNEIRKEFSIFEQNQNVVKQEVKTLEILEVEFQNQISKLIDKQAK
jgi:FtsZ-binding cell division protein ZapB